MGLLQFFALKIWLISEKNMQSKLWNKQAWKPAVRACAGDAG